MNYEGDLYGKVGGMVFKTGKTSKDWDNMEARLKELEAENLALKQANGVQASEATAILQLVSFSEAELCSKPNCNRPKLDSSPLCSYHFDIANS